MASKKYSYYSKGNKVAIVQQDTTDSSSEDYGKYKSPIENVDKGLEIEYSYSPWYDIPPVNLGSTNIVGCIGWTVVDGYLTFIEPLRDWSGMSSEFPVDGYFYVGTGPFAGIHKVQERQGATTGTHNGLKTYTKVNKSSKYISDPITWTSANTPDYYYAGVTNEMTSFDPSTEPYLWITGHSFGANNGFFSGWTYDAATDQLMLTIHILRLKLIAED